MKPDDRIREALPLLLLPEGGKIPDAIRKAHGDCLLALLRGDRREAYGQMVPILKHYHDKEEHLPPALERLYLTLLLNDVAAADKHLEEEVEAKTVV